MPGGWPRHAAQFTWRSARGTGPAGSRGQGPLPGRRQLSARAAGGCRGLGGCAAAAQVPPRPGRPTRRAPAGSSSQRRGIRRVPRRWRRPPSLVLPRAGWRRPGRSGKTGRGRLRGRPRGNASQHRHERPRKPRKPEWTRPGPTLPTSGDPMHAGPLLDLEFAVRGPVVARPRASAASARPVSAGRNVGAWG